MKNLFFLILFVSQTSLASIRALFHPHAPTLQVIAQVFEEAESSAQLVLYNIDVTNQSPLIQYMKSAHFQKKLQKGFKVQMIFEGYASPQENEAKMQALENLGVDVRFLGLTQKVHHKFAIIDAGLKKERLITGSANWSISSMNNYDENIFFMENEKGITSQFSHEFALLWNSSQEFGHALYPEVEPLPLVALKGDVHAFFNSSNYEWKKNSLQPLDELNPQLTKTVVAAINKARRSIEIATTRIKLAPIHEALMKAAERGVQIKIVVSQAEYVTEKSRDRIELKDCGPSLYSSKCSSGVNFSPLLDPAVTGLKNMQIRLKFFSLKLSENIGQQMHNKYMLIDGRWILSGSFNWSNSSEWNHLENLVVVDGSQHREVLGQFQENFRYVWNMNRDQSRELLQTSKGCGLVPSVLTFQEIDRLRQTADSQNICVTH